MPRQVMVSLVLALSFGVALAGEGVSALDYNAAGVEYYAAGDWLKAIENFVAAYDLTPDNPTVRRNLCNAYQGYANQLAEGTNYSAAAEQLEVAVKVDPGNASPLVQLGSYFLRMELVSDAIYRLEEAIQLAPENLDAHDLLGEAYYKDNDIPAALAQWEYVAEVEPNRKGLQQKLEKAYREEPVERNYKRTGSRHFQISFAPDTRGGELTSILTQLERAYRDIGRKFGGIYPPSPIQVVVYTAEDFSDATELGEHVAALYDGKIRIPLCDRAGNGIPEQELRRRLFHEYTHVLVRYLCEDKVPWWLNEGLAETFSNDLSTFDVTLLKNAHEQSALIPLKTLEPSQLEMQSVSELRLAYTQAHATVQFLWRKFGQARLIPMLDALALGVAPEDALKQSYRRTYDSVEKEMIGSVVLKGYR